MQISWRLNRQQKTKKDRMNLIRTKIQQKRQKNARPIRRPRKKIQKITKQQQKQLQKIQKQNNIIDNAKLDYLQQTAIQTISKLQDEAKQSQNPTPETVVQQVQFEIKKKQQQIASLSVKDDSQAKLKQQILQKNQVNKNFMDTGIVFNRKNYLNIVDKFINQINKYDPQNAQILKKKYSKMRINQRLLSTTQLEARLKILYSIYQSYQQGWPIAQKILNKISIQRNQIEKDPQQWFGNYLANDLKIQQDSPTWQTFVQDPKIFTHYLTQRMQFLENKQKYVRSHIRTYYKKNQQQKLDNINKLNELMQMKTQYFQQQKEVLTYLVVEGQKNIKKIQQQIVQQKQRFDEQLKKTKKQNQTKLMKQKQQKQVINGKLQTTKKNLQKDQQKLRQQQKILIQQNQVIQQKNQKISFQQKENKQLIQMLYAQKKQNQTLKQVNKKLISQNINLSQIIIQYRKRQIQGHQRQIYIRNQAQKQILLKSQLNESNLIKMHQQVMKQKNIRLSSEKQLKDQNMKKINDLQLNHQLSLNNYKQMIDKQVKTQIYQNNSQFQARILQQKKNFLQQNTKIMGLLKGKQKQYQQYKNNAINSINTLKVQLQNSIIQKKNNNELTKKKQQQMINKIKLLQQKQRRQSQMKLRILNSHQQLENKTKQEIQQLMKNIKNKQKQKQIQLKLIRQKNQLEVGLLQKQIKQKVTQIDTKEIKLKKKELQVKYLEQQKKKKQQQLKKQQQRIRKLQQQNKQQKLNISNIGYKTKQLQKKIIQQGSSVIQYKKWYNKPRTAVTIRQCFKQIQAQKWIASTRGVNFSVSSQQNIDKVFNVWKQIVQKNQFPKQKIQQRIKGSNIIMLIDIYKNKSYFGLRQGYWNEGSMKPTRRGFNVIEKQLNIFLKNISEETPTNKIQNLQQYF